MEISLGMILFYAGAAGLVLFAAAGAICWIVFRRKRRRLLHSIETEYR